jgi:hypothetical protein
MFDLEQAILEWRRKMLAAGVKYSNILDELESHLREDVEQRMQKGLDAEQAFEIAVRTIGKPAAIQNEFAKSVASNGTRWERLKCALLEFIDSPLPPSPRVFTDAARETLELSAKEALGFHHDFIGTEHVLLGLLELKTGVAPGVLRKLGVSPEIVRSEVEKIVGLGPAERTMRGLPYTPRVKKALKIAGSEARSLNKNHIDAEHVFLGLLLEGGGVAALVLKTLGVDIESARAAVLVELGRNRHEG